MMQRINHPELWKKSPIFDNDFKHRFDDITENAKVNFIEQGKFFIIDISNQREVLFQLISSELLINPMNKSFGLHLSNDNTNLNYKDVQIKMEDISKSSGISKIEIDEIETYQKYYSLNVEELYRDIENILTIVFEENIEELELDIFEP